MIYIPIAINNKVATVPCGTYIVADNTDYVLSFTFDGEWGGYPQKTARILIGSQYSDIDFTGNTVTIPPIASTAASILVGVYADGIATTTPATVHVFASVLGSTGTEYEPVDPTVLPDAPEVAADDTITITDVSEGARARATIGQIADVVAPLIPEQAARFEATYNETPFASILAAYNNNKVVVLTMSGNEIPLHSISSTKATFVGFSPEGGGGTNAEKISVTSSNVWSYGVFDYYTTEEVNAAIADLTATDTALAGRIATIEGKEPGWDAKYDAYTPGGIPLDSLSAETQLEIFAGRQAYDALSGKQDTLSAGENITIEGRVISATGGSSANAVLYTLQTLNDAQKTQARSNIGAASLSDIGTVFTVKGEVATVADLPASGNAVGDVYYVSSVSAGYVWLETTDHPSGYWEELGEPIDLSAYRTAANQDVIDLMLAAAIPPASSATPQALGTAAAGSSENYARADHVHDFDADFKAALLQLAAKVAYIDGDGQTYYDALEAALTHKALSSITAVFTQGGATIYDTDSLDTLNQYLTVTAHYSDNTDTVIADSSYTLSGTLTAGASTITVSYGGKTTTFTATVTAMYELYDYINYTGEYINNNNSGVARIIRTKKYADLGSLKLDLDIMPNARSTTIGSGILGGQVAAGDANQLSVLGRIDVGRVSAFSKGVAVLIDNVPNMQVGSRVHVTLNPGKVSPTTITADSLSATAAWGTYNTVNCSIGLFGKDMVEWQNTATLTPNVAIGTLKVYDLDNNLLNEYKPCVRNSDNLIGIYDTVEGVFYTCTTTNYAKIGNANCIYAVGSWS